MADPFKPTAGARPPQLIGRAEIVEAFAESLEDGPGAPALLSIFTGPRGIGKTVMLSAIEEEARKAGWLVISERANVDVIQRITAQVDTFESELASEKEPHWRHTITRLLIRLAEMDKGLLITVDEIHAIDRDELDELATVVQHLIREGLPIGLAMAGQPQAVSDLLNDGATTFLRRAERYDVRTAPISEVRTSFAETFSESGVQIDEQALSDLANATGGHPFLIQLVGYHVWRRAHRDQDKVTQTSLTEGIISGLSSVDQST
ncbi:ATP-binding protein [Citricoccus sp. NR2]|uniref:ATP-binding protein n=1 Tax=Citricoccus sp. NR2 TaxID=3004095 RepID=UPI0022DD6563|nr:ATP-binding protein [Citricoccus sp. NR2]WBL19745.1 ATP-binding protein [Citricoccus sp. NR2]